MGCAPKLRQRDIVPLDSRFEFDVRKYKSLRVLRAAP